MPLILAGKSVAAGTTCDAPVSLVNLYPTLVNLCGLPKNDANEGVDLTPLLQNPVAEWERPALTTHGQGNHSLRTKRWRYTRWGNGSEELYDHANDPEAWTNLANNPEYESLKQQLSKWFPQQNASDALNKAKARKKTESRNK